MKPVSSLLVIAAFMLAFPVAHGEERPPFDHLEGQIQARIAGIDFAQMNFDIHLNKDSYLIETETKSDGAVSFVWNYHSRVRAQGRMKQGDIVPVSYELFSHYWNTDRKTALEFDRDGSVRKIHLNPTAEEDKREPVPTDRITGSVDPASIFLSLLDRQNTGAGLCDFSLKLFDGYRLNKLDGKIPGKSKVFPGNDAGFDAQSLQYCQADAEQLAGRRLEDIAKDKQKLSGQGSEENDPADIWFARPAGTSLLMPVWVQKETSFGLVEFRLQTLTVTRSPDAVLAWNSLPDDNKTKDAFYPVNDW